MSNEVIDMLAPAPVLTPPAPVPAMQQPAPSGPMGMAMQAMSMGMTVADLHSLLALQKDYEANEARKAYVADMVLLKMNPPEILKDKHVNYTGTKGTVDYDHATIGGICSKVITAAAQHGFSHRWKPTQNNGSQISVTCVITHRLGHFEETTLEGPPDQSGGKNAIQGVASTTTYLSRYSLLMGFGFATKDMPDDDGRGACTPVNEGAKEDPATTVLKEWIQSAQAATTHEDLTRIRNEGCAAFQEVKDLAGWEKLKEAIKAHRATLPAKAAQS